MKLYFDNGRNGIYDTNNKLVLLADNLTCPAFVLEEVAERFNNTPEGRSILGPDGTVDMYLLDEPQCTQDDREAIVEAIYEYLYPSEEDKDIKLNVTLRKTEWGIQVVVNGVDLLFIHGKGLEAEPVQMDGSLNIRNADNTVIANFESGLNEETEEQEISYTDEGFESSFW